MAAALTISASRDVRVRGHGYHRNCSEEIDASSVSSPALRNIAVSSPMYFFEQTAITTLTPCFYCHLDSLVFC